MRTTLRCLNRTRCTRPAPITPESTRSPFLCLARSSPPPGFVPTCGHFPDFPHAPAGTLLAWPSQAVDPSATVSSSWTKPPRRPRAHPVDTLPQSPTALPYCQHTCMRRPAPSWCPSPTSTEMGADSPCQYPSSCSPGLPVFGRSSDRSFAAFGTDRNGARATQSWLSTCTARLFAALWSFAILSGLGFRTACGLEHDRVRINAPGSAPEGPEVLPDFGSSPVLSERSF